MAARRLLIIMVVLLVVSSVAAALVPPPTERSAPEEGEETTTTRGRAPEGGRRPAGQVLTARIDAEGGRAERVTAQVGDQVALIVESRAFHEVEIPALGLLEPVAPGSPARFDILIRRPGSFLVRLAGSGRAIARIEGREPRSVSRSARAGESKARARASRAGRES